MPDQLRILYVDDELSLLDLGKLFLEESGRFNVEIISSAPAALTLLNTRKYDAIISDYQMPGMDGIGFLKSVRASGNAIPFILFTGRGREEIVIQALNEGANFYLQKGGEPEAQFAELVHKIQIAVEHHRAAEKIKALNRLYSVLSATNKAIFRIQTKGEFFSEICRILVETGGFRMAWIGFADPVQNLIRPAASAGHVDGYLDSVNISTEDVPEGRGPTGTAFREGKYYWSNDITQDPRMELWRKKALKRGYLANAAFPFALGTKNAGVLSVYAPVTGFFDAPIIDLLDELSVDISFYLGAIDEQANRKSAEQNLQQEQLFSKSVLDSLPGIFYLYTYPECRLILWNKQHEVLLGYETGEMKGRHITDWHAPETKELVMNAIESVMKTGQGSMDALLLTKYGHTVPFFLTGVRFEANGELYVMGIGIDVTERKRAEADLRVSEEALSAMLNGITESAFLMTPEGIVIAANETVARRLGMKQVDDLVGQNALKLLSEDVQMNREIKIREVIQSGLPVHFEDVREGRVISQTVYPVKDPDGFIRRLAIFGVDVTDRKLTEEALHETDARLRFALRSAKSGTWDWDFPTGKLVWSPEFYELFGLPQEVPPSFKTWVAALHPEDRKPSMEKIDQSVKDHKDLWNEFRVLLPEGGLRWIGAAGSTSYNDQGEPLRMSGICIDISERKQAEEALRESETQYRLLADNATDVIWTLDLDGSFTYISPSIFQLRGYTQEEVMQQSLREVMSEGSLGTVQEMMQRMLEDVKSGVIPAPEVIEVEQPRRDGSFIWTESIARLLVDATGIPTEFIGVSRNITERKRAGEELLRKNEELNASYEQIAATEEELRNNLDELTRQEQALRESEANLRAILDATPFPVALVDLQDNNINYWSRNALTKFGHTAPTAPEWYQLAYPDPGYRQEVIDRWKPYLEQAKLSGQPVNTGEYRVTCRDGTVRICELYATFLADKLVVTFNDVTERKQAEKALGAREEQYRTLLDSAGIGIAYWSYDGVLLHMNRQGCLNMGLDDCMKIIGKNIRDLSPSGPENEYFLKRIRNMHYSETDTHYEDEVPMPAGRRWFLSTFSNVKDDKGTKTGVQILSVDITERKMAEELLRESEGRLRMLSDAAFEGIMIHDKGVIVDSNLRFAEMFGYTPEEIVGRNGFEFMLTSDSRDAISKWRESGLIGSFDVTGIRKDGSLFYGETTSGPVLWQGKQHAIVKMRDITERKLREETHAFLVQSGYPGSGEDFFNSLARYLAEHLNMDYVCIDTLEGDGLTAQTVAVYNDGKFDTNVRYALKDTPCGVVVGKTICCFSDEVCRLFPNDPALQDLGARSYIGTTLWSSEGKPIGLIALIRRKPLQNPELAKAVLEMVAMRAAGELERRLGEKALQESEEKYRKYIDHSPEGVFIVDADGNYTDVNPSACFMLGYSREEFLVRSVRDMVPPDHLSNSLSRFSKLKETGILMTELLLIKKNGDLLPVILNAVKMPDGKYLGFCTDITEQKRAEDMLRTLTTHLIHAQKIGHVGSFDFNIPENKVIWSEEMFSIFGQEPQASPLSIEHVRKMIHPDDRELQREQTEKIMETGSYEFEHRLIRPDGDIRWIAGRAEMVEYDAANAPVRMLGTMQDITDRKRFEEVIRESRQILDAIINTIPARVFWKDKDLTYIGCNTQFARDAGFEKPEDVIGKDDYTMSWREQAELYRADDRLVIESGRPRLLIEEPQTTPSREKISLLTSKVPLKDATGEIIGVLGTYLDITERKKAEEVLQRTNKKLNLLSSITRHDITNQLAVLMGYLTILEKKQPDHTLSEYFSRVKTTAERISSMIRFTQEYEAIGVNAPAWQECRKLVDTAVKQAPLGKVIVKNDIPAGTEIFADPLVMKVFYNLMDNAVQYGGKITKIRFYVEESGDDHIIVCEDDGEGIRADEKEKIFERGYGKNTGLGLALSIEILSITGITIKETGEPGKGARFEITVPKGMYQVMGNPV